MDVDEKQYSEALPYLERGLQDLGERIGDILRGLGDRSLVRARVERPRIKKLASLKRKAAQYNWQIKEAFEKAFDLVGHRVVCNNLQDVERAADLLEGSLKRDGISVRRIDYVNRPTKTGYRAIHLLVKVPVEINKKKMEVGCEVQVRSLLQHSWAELSRADIYAADQEIDPTLSRSMQRLSKLLQVADEIANDIREQISLPREGAPVAQGAPLTGPAIAFLFRRVFGSDPPDYVVEATLREFEGTPVRSDGLEAALKDESLIDKLKSAYGEESDWEPDSSEIFRWVVHAVTRGTNFALQLVRSESRSVWEDEGFDYRGEVLLELPETWQQLVDDIAHPAKDEDVGHEIRRWARGLETLKECGICGTEIVQSDSLAEELVDHYNIGEDEADEARQAIEYAIINSGVEVGSWNHPSLCNYHGYVMDKDD